ncbi:hypothetical protein ACFQ9Y_24920 [Peribacillus simplex]
MAVTVFGVGGANTSVKEVKLLTVKLLELLLLRAAYYWDMENVR